MSFIVPTLERLKNREVLPPSLIGAGDSKMQRCNGWQAVKVSSSVQVGISLILLFLLRFLAVLIPDNNREPGEERDRPRRRRHT